MEQQRIPDKHFVIPGGTPVSAALDLARTIVRRAERCVVKVRRLDHVHPPVALYLNRLSDLLFVLARCVEQEELVVKVTSNVMENLAGTNNVSGEIVNMMTLNKAMKMIQTAEAKAKEIEVPMVIAVVDCGGNLVAQHRMDGAILASISISLDKAYTAVSLKMPTEKAAKPASPGQSLYGLNTTNGGRLVIFGGGIPVFDKGVLIGGIGVSGGAVEDDITVAKAGLAGL
ncbi:hypothetical protein N752_16605 [Desulforamulus aquiferis]|nr:ATP:cob(I)alamin adenosyltransferase [Desulforamulus aquiferis]RYD04010.1 hypothetical protein N752_16605 [Desulforamulus aquiferis]